MNAKNTSAVFRAWLNGERAHSGGVSTDGWRVWSYDLLIAARIGDETIVADYTASGVHYSTTTSRHVAMAQRAAGVDKIPPAKFREMVKD